MERFFKKLGYLFYIVDPKENSFEKIDQIPNYINEVVPFFIALLIVEQAVAYFKKKPMMMINDSIGSVSQGMLLELSKIFLRSLQLMGYIWLYENWRLLTLPWDSVWTWWICFLGVDFGYYWLHRASHELNIFWAAHQVHHSSENYNLSTALRQSVVQHYVVMIFYLPLAFAIPPAVFIVHLQFNTLYQFWIHTEIVKSIGPLEYILNTPSHHRVHHGRNRYCIDKNYAGTLIIWDRLFGTFEAEKDEVVYGLTHPINTFDPFYIQFCHYMHIWRTFCQTSGLKNKLSVIFKGPGWEPGKPWHGLIEDIPDVSAPVEKYSPQLPLWCNVYTLLHFILLIFAHVEITERYRNFSQFVVIIGILYIVFSLTTIGAVLDKKSYAPWLELLRCILYFTVDYYILPYTHLEDRSIIHRVFLHFVRTTFLLSAILWSVKCLKATSIHIYSKKIA